MYIIGIDTGFSGAIAFIAINGRPLTVDNMPIVEGERKEIDAVTIRKLFKDFPPSHVFIEKAQCRPGQSITAVARYFCSYGILIGICSGLKIPYTLVHPAIWKKEMMAGMGKEKGESIVRCKQLFPTIDLPLKKDHGRADALLIAEYGRRTLKC